MDLRGLLRPVGPLPVGVYWRRRLVLLAGVAVVLVVLVEVLGGGSGGSGHTDARSAARSQTSRPTPPPRTTSTTRHPPRPAVTPRVTPAARAKAACASDAITLRIATDQQTYPAGVAPRFTMTVTNSGARACRVDVGPSVRSFLLYSGSDRIWSSADCGGSGHVVTTLAPKQSLAYDVTWPRQRSAKGCPASEPSALPGFYRVTAHLGSLSSTEALFSLS